MIINLSNKIIEVEMIITAVTFSDKQNKKSNSTELLFISMFFFSYLKLKPKTAPNPN